MKREGLEPSTLGLEDRCSIQLSYRFRQIIVYNFTSIIVNVVDYILHFLYNDYFDRLTETLSKPIL